MSQAVEAAPCRAVFQGCRRHRWYLERARECGAFTVGITNEASSTLAKISEHVILVRAGREKSFAATKTYTGQLMAVNMLA